MGAGGRMSDSFEHEVKDILKCVPVDPPFSLSDLKKAITAHCFERSVIRSSYYVVHDLIVAYVFYFLVNTYIPLLPTPLAYLASAVLLNGGKDERVMLAYGYGLEASREPITKKQVLCPTIVVVRGLGCVCIQIISI
ncbi:plastid delta12-fatty acid acetylenase, partial [Tanacetum coccineum]